MASALKWIIKDVQNDIENMVSMLINERIDSGREELLKSAILFEIMIVIDAAAEEVGSFWKCLETNLRIQGMNWCKERREGRYEDASK